MATKRRYDPTVTEAAEYLHAIYDEFKSKSETAAIAMRRARILLDVSVNEAVKAIEANAVADREAGLAKKLAAKKGRR